MGLKVRLALGVLLKRVQLARHVPLTSQERLEAVPSSVLHDGSTSIPWVPFHTEGTGMRSSDEDRSDEQKDGSQEDHGGAAIRQLGGTQAQPLSFFSAALADRAVDGSLARVYRCGRREGS
jgi:hypothetical protein